MHFLKTDFDKWVDEDEQDGAADEDLGGMDSGAAGMGGMDPNMMNMMGGMGGGAGGMGGKFLIESDRFIMRTFGKLTVFTSQASISQNSVG